MFSHPCTSLVQRGVSSYVQFIPLSAGFAEAHAARPTRRRRTGRTINHHRFIGNGHTGFATHDSILLCRLPETVNAQQSMIHSGTPLYLSTLIL